MTVIIKKTIQDAGNLILIDISGLSGILKYMYTNLIPEIEVVKQVPILSSYEQPTIAIITALYCEKIAVDAMLDNKKTFVKFKSEGKSNVIFDLLFK